MTEYRFGVKEMKLDTYGHTYQFSSYVRQVNPRKRMHMMHGITHRVQGDQQ